MLLKVCIGPSNLEKRIEGILKFVKLQVTSLKLTGSQDSHILANSLRK